MPCRDYSPNESSLLDSKKLHDATRVACEALKLLTNQQIKRLSPHSIRWWQEHQAKDRARLAKERQERAKEFARRRALDKLTEEEKLALGIGPKSWTSV
jgi:uncharacterized membrane-anchored protein YhcB (DUF1043 family)